MPSVARKRQPPRVKNAIYIALHKSQRQRLPVSDPIAASLCSSIPNDRGDSSPALPERSSSAARNGPASGLNSNSPLRVCTSITTDSGDTSAAVPDRSSPLARNGSVTDSHLMSTREQYSRLASLSKDDRPLAHVLVWHPLLKQTPALASCLETWIACPQKALDYAILQEASCWPDVIQKVCEDLSTLKPDRHSILVAFERSVPVR